MNRTIYLPALLLMLAGAMMLSACAGGSQPAPTAVPTQAIEQATATITRLPTQPSTAPASPYPYPQPALVQPTQSGVAYPTPGQNQPAVIDSYPTATGPYPPPGLDSRSAASF